MFIAEDQQEVPEFVPEFGIAPGARSPATDQWILGARDSHPASGPLKVLRLNIAQVCRLGGALMLVKQMERSVLNATAHLYFLAVREQLGILASQNVIRLPISHGPCVSLHNRITSTIDMLLDRGAKDSSFWGQQFDFGILSDIKSQADSLELILFAEMQVADIYAVTERGGYNTTLLSENGQLVFPADLLAKVPAVLLDAKAAARCIAFDLPTAAAFHLHRVHESVLRRYYDVVTIGKPHPDKKNIGAYMDALKNNQINDKVLFATLANVRDHHRNPVLHPEDRLESTDEAIRLLGIINSSLGYMLKSIPVFE